MTYPYTYTTFAVDIPYAVGSIKTAEARVTAARDTLAKALTLSEISDAQNQLTNALKDLDNALNKLTFGQGDSLFQLDQNGRPISRVGTDYWSLRSAQLDIQNAQAQLDNASNNLANEKTDLAKTLVKAPFSGLITNVSATDGAIINKGNVAVTMTNPNKLEADVLVNEIDIFNVKINGTANVSVDAANGLIVPATITYVQPTATIQSGVVNYSVKVELNQTAATNSSGNATQAPFAEATPAKGKIVTQNTASLATLRQGLSVTVSILKETKKNVLLVPNRAIIRQGTTAKVQVMSNSGAGQTQTIQTGTSDNRNTEVTQGLAEGEKVIIQNAATRAATPATGFGPFGGGMGR
jgi:multidrug resistance efflux pump